MGGGTIIKFILGSMLGGIVGVVAMALCQAATYADRYRVTRNNIT